MSETPVAPDPIAEMPVMDPRAFLLHRTNHDYLSGQRHEPMVSLRMSEISLLLLIAGMVGMVVSIGIMLNGDGLSVITGIGILLFLLSLAGSGVILQSSLRAPVTRAGRVLEGTIIEAEKIRIQQGQRHTESIGVRYAFTTPDGKRLQNRAEALMDETGRTMAPAPGTPVYVWYESDSHYYLL